MKYMEQKNNITTFVKGIVVALLLLCLIDADSGFYQAMRTLISFGFAFLAYRYYQTGDKTKFIVYFCLLIVFQPLLRIGLGRGIWIMIDIGVAGYIIYQLYQGIFSKRPTMIKDGESFTKENTSSVKRQGNLRINFPDKEMR